VLLTSRMMSGVLSGAIPFQGAEEMESKTWGRDPSDVELQPQMILTVLPPPPNQQSTGRRQAFGRQTVIATIRHETSHV